MSFRLFVSYSAQWPDDVARQAAVARLLDLKREIERVASQSGADVLVTYDREPQRPGIRPGDDWRQRIAFMLHECQAAVIVLDEPALRSKWVLAEATFLALRRLAEPQFRLVPVSYLDQADLEREKAARAQQREFLRETVWDVIAADSIQFVQGRTPAQVASAVVAALLAAGELQPMRTPIELLADLVAKKIRAEAAPMAAAQLVEQLHVVDTLGGRDVFDNLAVGLTRAVMESGRLTAVRALLAPLGPNSLNELRRQVLEELAALPYDPDAAAVLRLPREGGGCRHASVQTWEPSYTLPRYLQLAYLSAGYDQMAVENLDGSEAGIRAALRAAWRLANPSSRLAADSAKNDEAIDNLLAQHESHVLIPAPLDGAVLRALEARYPRLTFVVHHGPQDNTLPLPEGVLAVMPELDPDVEEELLMDYDIALANLA